MLTALIRLGVASVSDNSLSELEGAREGGPSLRTWLAEGGPSLRTWLAEDGPSLCTWLVGGESRLGTWLAGGGARLCTWLAETDGSESSLSLELLPGVGGCPLPG